MHQPMVLVCQLKEIASSNIESTKKKKAKHFQGKQLIKLTGTSHKSQMSRSFLQIKLKLQYSN